MSIRDFIEQTDANIGSKWAEDRVELEYSEEEARVAVALTRLDSALNASVNCYNGKTLESIKTGVWILVAVSSIHLLKAFF